MRTNTGIQVRVDEATGNRGQNSVRIELSSESAVESLVLAYRHDGELVELAERAVPATAELHGELE